MNDGILVACIGNIFLGDDGFGFEVAQALAGAALPPGVDVRDFGIRGLDLAYALLLPWKAVVLVDAVVRGGEPGTLYLLQPHGVQGKAAAPDGCLGAALDPHVMDPVRVLTTARSLGPVDAEIYILGCEPQDFGLDPGDSAGEGRIGLSPPVAAAIPEAVAMIQTLSEKLAPTAVPEQAA